MLSNRQAVVEEEQNLTPTARPTLDNVHSMHVERIKKAANPALAADVGSFQLFHKRSKALMNQGVEFQLAIRENRTLRASLQKQLFRVYAEISNVNPSVETGEDNNTLLVEIKEKITHLDTEHTSLNKRFVHIQSQILQAVKNQRIRLVKGPVNIP